MRRRWICQNSAGVELVAELPDGLRMSDSPSRGDDQRVLVVGLEIEDLVDRDEARLAALRGVDPAQVFVRSGAARASSRQQAVEVRRRCVPMRSRSRAHASREALGAESGFIT